MPLVSEIWTWEEGDRLFSRLTTNAPTSKFIARLVELNLLESVETIHAYFGDRVDGGSGYEILWKDYVRWTDLKKLVRL